MKKSLIKLLVLLPFTLSVCSADVVQQAYLKAPNNAALPPDFLTSDPSAIFLGLQVSDSFGYAVGVSGDTLVIGAMREDGDPSGVQSESWDNAGAAYVFVRIGDA